jgi:tetratricopeptide (TPR) repeat protein
MVKQKLAIGRRTLPRGRIRIVPPGVLYLLFFLVSSLPAVPVAGQNRAAAPEVLFQQAAKLEQAFERATTYDAKEIALLGLADVYQQIRRFDRAIESIERLREQEGFDSSPRREVILLKLGSLYELRGNLEGAAEVYSDAMETARENEEEGRTETDPAGGTSDFLLRKRYISVLERLGRFEEAREKLLEIVSEGDAGNKAFAIGQLVSLYRNGNLSDKDIAEIADPLLEEYPREAVRLAGALENRGRTAAAKYFYDEVLRRAPEALLPVAEEAAKFYQSQDTLDQMIQELEESVEGSIDRVRLLVRFYRYRGDLGKALETIRREAAEKKRPELVREAADLEMAAGQYEEAAKSYEEYIRQTRGVESHIYRKLGEAYFLAGRKEEATRAWHRMLPALGNSASAYLTLSETLDQYGMTDAAVEMMEEAIKRSPSSSYYVPRLLHLYLKNNRFDDAVLTLAELAGNRRGLDRTMTDSLLRATETPEAQELLLEAAHAALEKTALSGRSILLDLLFEIYIRSGRYEEAIEQVKSIKGLPGEQRLFILGQNLRAFGEAEAAARAYRNIPPSSPYYLAARVAATEALVEIARPGEALTCAAAAIRKITGSEKAAAAVEEASPEFYEMLSGQIAGATEWEAGRRRDLSELLVSLGDLWVREKEGRPALSALLLASRIPTEGRRLSSRNVTREAVLTGHAYALLGDFQRARRMYELVSDWEGPTGDEAEFMVAELDLWEGKSEEAKERYDALLGREPARNVINEVLARMYFLSQLAPEEVEVYSAATRFAWQGRWDDAIDRYRMLAVRREGDHIAGWSLLAVGDILARQGKTADARAEWERLLGSSEDIALRGQLRFRLLEAGPVDAATDTETIYEGYRAIIEDMPDTIFADEARRVIDES